MDRYLIIADDFTGANDTGVQLKRRGLRTSVIFAGRKPPEDEGCVVVDTESRGVGAEEAAEVMRLACGELRFDDYKYVIKKVDPSLRGNIAAESAVLDELYRPELVIFAPPLPAMGRTTEGGVHRLKGVPLSHTELAGDPKNPVHEDNIARLLAAAYGVQVHHIPLERVRGGFDLSGGRVFTFDAVTDEDLRLIIAGALDTGRRVLWIGTSALADNIMELERRTPPVLGVIGSLSEATGGQVRSSAEKPSIPLRNRGRKPTWSIQSTSASQLRMQAGSSRSGPRMIHSPFSTAIHSPRFLRRYGNYSTAAGVCDTAVRARFIRL